MGVTDRMHVTHGPVDARLRHFEDEDALGGVDPALGAGDHVGVVRPAGDHVGPVVKLEAVEHQGIGPPHLDHEARPHLEVMRVLIRPGHGVHLGQVSSDGLRERLEIGRGGDDSKLVCLRHGSAERQPHAQQRDGQRQVSSHRTCSPRYQNGWAGWAPRMNVA